MPPLAAPFGTYASRASPLQGSGCLFVLFRAKKMAGQGSGVKRKEPTGQAPVSSIRDRRRKTCVT